MKKSFHCWLHEHEKEEDGSALEAYAARWAAEEYAERAWYDETFELIEVAVRPAPGEPAQYFVVEVEYEPQFSVSRLVNRLDNPPAPV